MNLNKVSFFPLIKREEFLPLIKCFSFFFFVLASWYALRPVRNEMAIEGGIFNLPYILLAIVVVMGIVNPLYSWIISKIETKKIVIYCYSFFIFNLIVFLFLLILITDPKDINNSNIVSISFTAGTFVKIILFDKILAAKIGNEAFLDPEIFIEPWSFLSPVISNFSIN